MKVKDCMCNDVCCVKPETKIGAVAKLMSENHIGSIPVCDSNNCICGIVTDRDILLRCVACNKDSSTTPVSDVMTTDVCTCMDDDNLTNAREKMSENQVRRLPVCDCNNKVVGILTIGDLAQNTQNIGAQEVCSTIEGICDCNNNSKNAE